MPVHYAAALGKQDTLGPGVGDLVLHQLMWFMFLPTVKAFLPPWPQWTESMSKHTIGWGGQADTGQLCPIGRSHIERQ